MESLLNDPVNQLAPDPAALELLANTHAAQKRAALEVFELSHPDNLAVQLSYPEAGKVHRRVVKFQRTGHPEYGLVILGASSSDAESGFGVSLFWGNRVAHQGEECSMAAAELRMPLLAGVGWVGAVRGIVADSRVFPGEVLCGDLIDRSILRENAVERRAQACDILCFRPHKQIYSLGGSHDAVHGQSDSTNEHVIHLLFARCLEQGDKPFEVHLLAHTQFDRLYHRDGRGTFRQ